MPKWIVRFALVRVVEIEADDNINDVFEKADREKRPGERIIDIHMKSIEPM